MFTKSGHGFINKEELSSVFSTGYVEMEPEVWEQMVDQADADSDGRISYQEFRELMGAITLNQGSKVQIRTNFR